jgi:DNA-binding MarR family transcriptional regulator
MPSPRNATGAQPKTPTSSAEHELHVFLGLPGHLIRRSKQKSTLVFTERCASYDVTPIQFAVLRVLQIKGELDRSELREIVGLDNSTIGEVIPRLQKRGLLSCRAGDARQQICSLTPTGSALVTTLTPVVAAAQDVTLAPLTARERRQLLRLLSKLVGIDTSHYALPASHRGSAIARARRAAGLTPAANLSTRAASAPQRSRRQPPYR